MKCLILAAGYATRLYPLTENFPKPLLKVGEKSILDWLVDDLVDTTDIDEFVVISNHKFAQHFEDWKSNKQKTRPYEITVIDDGTSTNETRLGAVKDIQLAVEKLKLADDLLVMAGDNVLDFSLSKFVEFAKEKNTSCVMCHEENELKKQQKPFIVLVNSQMPYKDAALKTAEEIQQKYKVTALTVNCDQLRKEDIARILEKVLYEFPVSQIQFFIPRWVEMLPLEHELKQQILSQIRDKMKSMQHIRDITKESVKLSGPYVQDSLLEDVGLSDGTVKVRIRIKEEYYYRMLSQMSGIEMESEYELIHTMQELVHMKEEYVKVQAALEAVRGTGYGVVVPNLDEIEIAQPEVIRQGNKYGVKIKSKSPSIHMIKANIETEIAPIVGTEQQAKDLIQYIDEGSQRGESIWETNIFGKSIEQLVQDGIRSKIAAISEESQVKLQDTMQKIVNDSKGGLVCIII